MRRFSGVPCEVLGCGRTRKPGAIMCARCWAHVPVACRLALDDHDRRVAWAMHAERVVSHFGKSSTHPENEAAWRQEAELRPFLAWSRAETVSAAQRLAFECRGEA